MSESKYKVGDTFVCYYGNKTIYFMITKCFPSDQDLLDIYYLTTENFNFNTPIKGTTIDEFKKIEMSELVKALMFP